MTFATYVGLDLHKRHITACALAADGTLLGEVRRMPVTMEALLDFLTALPTPTTIAVEATLSWAWLHERLECAGYVVHVVDAYKVKLIWQARSKTDPIDARKLAELLRVNLLPTIWIPDAATRARQPLPRGRAFLVRQRTQVKNRFREEFHRNLGSENIHKLRLLSRVLNHLIQVFKQGVLTNCLSPALPVNEFELGDSTTRFEIEFAPSVSGTQRKRCDLFVHLENVGQTEKNADCMDNDVDLPRHPFHHTGGRQQFVRHA